MTLKLYFVPRPGLALVKVNCRRRSWSCWPPPLEPTRESHRPGGTSGAQKFACDEDAAQRRSPYQCNRLRLLAGSRCSTSTIRTWWARRGRISAAHACRAFGPRLVPAAADLGQRLRDGPVPRQNGTSSARARELFNDDTSRTSPFTGDAGMGAFAARV